LIIADVPPKTAQDIEEAVAFRTRSTNRPKLVETGQSESAAKPVKQSVKKSLNKSLKKPVKKPTGEIAAQTAAKVAAEVTAEVTKKSHTKHVRFDSNFYSNETVPGPPKTPKRSLKATQIIDLSNSPSVPSLQYRPRQGKGKASVSIEESATSLDPWGSDSDSGLPPNARLLTELEYNSDDFEGITEEN
jgi:hypothetical protein